MANSRAMRASSSAIALLALLGFGGANAVAAPGPVGPLIIDSFDDVGRFFVGGVFSTSKSNVELQGDDFEYEQTAIALNIGKQIGRSWCVTLAVGLVLGGELEIKGDREFDIDRGFMTNLSVLRLFTFGGDERWFVAPEAAVGTSIASSAQEEPDGTEFDKENVTGLDLRAGLMAGVRIARLWRPYLAVRGLYQPLTWTLDGEGVDGSNDTFVQVAGGLMVEVPLGFSVGVEYGFLAERRLAVGLSSRL